MQHPSDKEEIVFTNYKEHDAFELQFGFKLEEPYKVVQRVRDRYGAKERKAAEIELEWAVRRAEERELDKILPEDKLYNQWWDMTKSKFWQEFAQCDVTYHGITTKFKKLKQ